MLTASGQAASMLSITNICHSGDHVVCASAIYGGTFNLFNKSLRELGIDFTFVTPDATEETINAAFQDNTRAVFVESVSNPSLDVADVELYAKLAHAHGVPLIVDNTFPTPVLFRPFEWGADIVVHSTSKYMDGHAVALGGVIVDSGNFDWTNGKYPAFTEPDESYHGVIYTEKFGKAAYITKCVTHMMRDYGPQQSPQNAFLLNLGRCGVISFGVKGGREKAMQFMDSLELTKLVIHVADARTCALHPASTTHRQLTDQQLEDCGVKPNLIRMSVGIEYVDDILADIKQALDKI